MSSAYNIRFSVVVCVPSDYSNTNKWTITLIITFRNFKDQKVLFLDFTLSTKISHISVRNHTREHHKLLAKKFDTEVIPLGSLLSSGNNMTSEFQVLLSLDP